MADAPTPSPELSRSVLVLARTLVAAARSGALYSPEHLAVGASLDHVRAAVRDAVPLEEPMLVNTREPDGRGDFPWAVVEAVDPETAGIDPLQYM